MALYQALNRLGQNKFPRIIARVKNGECQFHKQQTDNVTDDQGFPAPVVEERRSDFIPCVWEVRGNTETDAREQIVGSQTTPFVRYKLTVPMRYADAAVEVDASDIVYLRTTVGSLTPIRLEVTGVINVSNVHWLVNATEVADANEA